MFADQRIRGASGAKIGSSAVRLSLCMCMWLLACAPGVGPLEAPQFEEVVRQSIDLRGEAIRLHGRAMWWPGADAGRFDLDSEWGVLVLQKTRLLFLGWNSGLHRYEIKLEIAYAQARDVRRRVWGVSQRIVVETANRNTDAFMLTSNNGSGPSFPRINRALAILREEIPSSDARVQKREAEAREGSAVPRGAERRTLEPSPELLFPYRSPRPGGHRLSA